MTTDVEPTAGLERAFLPDVLLRKPPGSRLDCLDGQSEGVRSHIPL